MTKTLFLRGASFLPGGLTYHTQEYNRVNARFQAGVCVECAEPIAPARLEAAPEVETCIRCQAGIEHPGRWSASSRRGVFAGFDIEAD